MKCIPETKLMKAEPSIYGWRLSLPLPEVQPRAPGGGLNGSGGTRKASSET